MKLQLTVLMLISTLSLYSQVGIGTTDPKAALDIVSTGNLPALELVPQTSPQGTVAGQIAVIGSELYLYDSRDKWLTIESSILTFGHINGRSSGYLEYSGDIIVSGPAMPRAGTIVYIAMNTSTGGSTKQINVEIKPANGGAVAVHSFNLNNGKFIQTDADIDVVVGDEIRVNLPTSTDGQVFNPSVTLWIKWRK